MTTEAEPTTASVSTDGRDPGAALAAHYASVLDAEVARLVSAMCSYRVVRESTLREQMHGDLWGSPGFDAALASAVESGQLEQLLGYVRLPAAVPDNDATRAHLLERMTHQLRQVPAFDRGAGGDS